MTAAFFYTKVHIRVFRPAFGQLADENEIPRPVWAACRRLEREIDKLTDEARLGKAA